MDLEVNRIELHLHLDSAFRVSTLWDIATKKGINLKFKNLEEFCAAVTISKPCNLADYLKPLRIIKPIYIGDAEALERGAYELCEDQAKEGVLYFEARYSPHGCSNTHSPSITANLVEGSPGALGPRQVVETIQRGLDRGQRDFGVKARSILCCVRGRPEWSESVLGLCQDFSSDGVVGIDISGSEEMANVGSNEKVSQLDVEVFQKAALYGVHRTVHAGEAGPASSVSFAIEELMAERIGHGYSVLQDAEVYEGVLERRIHLETCPYSSILTGAVSSNTAKHPIVRFAEDGANFSISTDDPTLIGKTLSDQYQLLRQMGLDEEYIVRANFNAARSSFLPISERNQLVEQLKQVYGTE